MAVVVVVVGFVAAAAVAVAVAVAVVGASRGGDGRNEQLVNCQITSNKMGWGGWM